MSLIHGLLPRQSSGCVDCSNQRTPTCNCNTETEDCVQINRDCYTCTTIKCQPKASTASSNGGGVSKGALAGAIVGVLIFLGICVALFFWYRRSPRFARNREAPQEPKEVPASAADVLSRPDPPEKPPSPTEVMNSHVRHYAGNSQTTIDLDPESQHSSPGAQPPLNSHRSSLRSNPFSDNHSIQTAGTEGTNVIPIALVSPDNRSEASDAPSRPNRSPELQLNLDHINVSHDNLRPGAGSQLSGVTGMSRNSYMTNASYSSDLLHEAPMIISPHQGGVRHVVGAVKAEMVDPRSSESLRTPTSGRPTLRSPLASSSFGPSDLTRSTSLSSDQNPFSDAHISMQTNQGSLSPSGSVTTFGQPSPPIRRSINSEVDGLAYAINGDERPTSMSTQAGSVIGSVIDIGTASRVNLSTGGSLYRTTVGRLVTPPSTTAGTLQEQQRKAALAYAQARVESQGSDLTRRTSGTSAISATADSILEAFPFVPPSPISNRPARSPPISPLGQQTFSVTPASPASQTFNQTAPKSHDALGDDLPHPPNRRTLGMSTGSQISTASSGLGSFPFQIDSESSEVETAPPSAYSGPRQRASLDTLAITSDLSSYPLGFDRDSHLPRQK